MTNNEMFKEFNELYQIRPLEHTLENLIKTFELINDELTELGDEVIDTDTWEDIPIEDVNRYNVAKELTDILYITMQRMTAMGLDVDALLEEVHRSNMSKQVPVESSMEELTIAKDRYPNAVYALTGDSTGVLRCKDTNKVIKPTCYSPAVITDAMIGVK